MRPRSKWLFQAWARSTGSTTAPLGCMEVQPPFQPPRAQGVSRIADWADPSRAFALAVCSTAGRIPIRSESKLLTATAARAAVLSAIAELTSTIPLRTSAVRATAYNYCSVMNMPHASHCCANAGVRSSVSAPISYVEAAAAISDDASGPTPRGRRALPTGSARRRGTYVHDGAFGPNVSAAMRGRAAGSWGGLPTATACPCKRAAVRSRPIACGVPACC